MAEAKHVYWVDAQFAVYFLATLVGQQPGATQALAQANELVAQYLNAGYEPLSVISLGESKLTLQGAGELDGTRVVVLWALQGHRLPADQRAFLELAEERQESHRQALVESERHRAAEDARQEVQAILGRAERQAERVKSLDAEISQLNV